MRQACVTPCIAILLLLLAPPAFAHEQDPHGPRSLTDDDLKKAADSVSIRDAAPTFPALAKTTGAHATWDRNLLWIKLAKNGDVEAFEMDLAYELQANGKSEWITLQTESGLAPQVAAEQILYTRARAILDAQQEYAPTARRVLTHPVNGEIYEIAWPSLTANGSGAWTYQRRIIVARSFGDRPSWKVLGEIEGDSAGRIGGGYFHYTQLHLQAWKERLAPASPGIAVEIRQVHSDSYASEEPTPDYSLSILRRGTAAWNGEPDKDLTVNWQNKSWFVPRKGDTVADLAIRKAWHSGRYAWDFDAKNALKRGQVEALWLAAILQANPTLKPSTIVQPQQVITPSETQVPSQIQALRDAPQLK